MTTDERDVVSAMRESLAGKVGKQKFDLWFADAAFAHSAGKLIVATPNEFKREVLRTNFAAHLAPRRRHSARTFQSTFRSISRSLRHE